MQNWIMAVTNDFTNMKTIIEEGQKHDIRVQYTYSINDAFEQLANRDFVLVAIRADGIDYMSKLAVMRELKPMPIMIFSYTYDVLHEREEALRMGADVFIATPFALEYIVESGLALIRMYERHGGNKRLEPGSVLTHGHITMTTQMKAV